MKNIKLFNNKNKLIFLLKTLPYEIITIIINYSYNIQSEKLRYDIKSYFNTKILIQNIFKRRNYWNYELNNNFIYNHLIFHLISYLTGLKNLYTHKKSFFDDVIQRTYYINNKNVEKLLLIQNCCIKNKKIFNFLWGLLQPKEREEFIQINIKF